MEAFSTVYLLDDAHVAGIQTTRYPANASLDFNEPPSLSFFLHNAGEAVQGVARFYLDGRVSPKREGDGSTDKYRVLDTWDDGSPSPCANYTYDFGEYGWWVNASWREILAHDENGVARRGSVKQLQDAFRAGAELKAGVTGLCDDLAPAGARTVPHEVFTSLHSIYNHEDGGFLGGESMPIVRVAPAAPLRYETDLWDYGWILPRTDGIVHKLIVNPYTRQVRQEARSNINHPPSTYLNRFYYDCLTHSEKSLRFLIDSVGVDRVVFGSDWPFDMAVDWPVSWILNMESLTLEEKEAILHKNLEALLGV